MISLDLTSVKDIINPKYYPYLKNTDRYLTFYGSAGSGKSHFIAQKFILRILKGLKNKVRHKFICLRKTQPAVRKSVFALFKKYYSDWKLNRLCKINNTEMSFDFMGISQILCGGLDDVMKLKSIEGLTGAWLEESTEFQKEDFRQINLRLRGETDSYKQICNSFNPISKKKWVFNEFFKEHKGKIIPIKGTVVHTTYQDNRYLDAEYIQVLEDLKGEDENYHLIYTLGKWGELKGLIYNNWSIIPEMPENLDEIVYGIDFGFNNPMVLLEIGIKDQDIYVDELVYESKLTTQDLIKRMESEIEDKSCTIKADPSEPDRIEEISQAGFNIEGASRGKKNSVKDGIDTLKRRKIYVTQNSVNTIEEFQTYKWKDNKDDSSKFLDEPVKFMDHSMDALRYGNGDLGNSKPGYWVL